MTSRGYLVLALGSLILAGCAAAPKAGEAATASPAPQGGAAASQPSYAAGQAQANAPEADLAPAAPPPPPPATKAPEPTGTYAVPPNRSVAIGQASHDLEASRRELETAGADCKSACRALGSMDRAAGRLCGLAQSNDESRRCSDAKTHVYSARDRVRKTCGSCPDVTVERNAPIPSH